MKSTLNVWSPLNKYAFSKSLIFLFFNRECLGQHEVSHGNCPVKWNMAVFLLCKSAKQKALKKNSRFLIHIFKLMEYLNMTAYISEGISFPSEECVSIWLWAILGQKFKLMIYVAPCVFLQVFKFCLNVFQWSSYEIFRLFPPHSIVNLALSHTLEFYELLYIF